ncbi:unnamed protein product [Meganyctiphanes norvegica]|uniref:tRNA (guanosine(18)-2'-O)-methyltransferase TARBP1 n=1 Tax=Meganyctiphanes norvegica TaxID=48144 RepID=A0AAV2QRS5_MEGNR
MESSALTKSSLLEVDDYCNLFRKLLKYETLNINTCKILKDLLQSSLALSQNGKTTQDNSKLTNLHNAILVDKVLPKLRKIVDSNTREINTGYLNIEHSLCISQDKLEGECETESGLLLLVQNLSSLTLLLVTSTFSDNSHSLLNPKNDNCLQKACNKSVVASDLCCSASTIDVILDSVKCLLNDIAYIMSNLKFDSIVNKEQHKNLKIISLVLSQFMGSSWCWNQSVFCPVLEMILDVTVSLLRISQDNDISAILINLVIQPSLDNGTHRRSNHLNDLWIIVKEFYVIKEGVVTEKNSTGYLILCFMASYIFIEENMYLVSDEDFWKVIQHGLTHTNPLTRKRSQYILKRGVEHYLQSLPNTKFSSYFSNVELEKRDAIQSLWYDFFLLVETLEEKQAHVIWPLCSKIDNLLECASTRNLIHITWVLVIFKRFMDHDNKNIKKWAIEKILTLEFSQEILNNGVLSFTFHEVLDALSDYSLYARDSGQILGTISKVGNQLAVFLQNITNSLNYESKKCFLIKFLANVFDGRTWGGIPLFFIIEGMNKLPKIRVLSYQEVKNALVVFETCLNAQDLTIRSMSQCNFIRFIFNTLHEEVTLLEICDLLRHFNRSESFCQGTWFWENIKEYSENFPDTYQEINSVHKALEDVLSPRSVLNKFSNPENIALGICIMLKSIDKEKVNDMKIFQPICSFLQDCNIRPYLDKEKMNWGLEVIVTIMAIFNESKKSINNENEINIYFEKEMTILKCLESSIMCVSLLFLNNVRSYNEPFDYQNLIRYLNLFEQCSSVMVLRTAMKAHLNDKMHIATAFINSDNQLKVNFGILLIDNIFTSFYEDLTHEDKIYIVDITQKKILGNILPITQQRYIKGYDKCEFTKALLLKTSESGWNCCQNLVASLKKDCQHNVIFKRNEIISLLLETLPEAIDTAGRVTIVPIFTIAHLLTSDLLQKNQWENIVSIMWETSKAFRRSDGYSHLLYCFTGMLFHREVLINQSLQPFVAAMSKKLLTMGENIQGLVKVLARSFIHTLICTPEIKPALTDVLLQEAIVPMLMYGNVFRKQDKVSMDVISYIRKCTTIIYDNSFDADTEARVYMLYMILSLKADCHTDRNFAQILTKSIMQQYTQLSGERRVRDFANSQIHRCKTRLLQAILLIIPLLDENSCSKCICWLSKGLIQENQQPSVRYLQEWALSLCVILHPTLYGTLYCFFQEGVSDRIGCVGSFLASLTHIATTGSNDDIVSQVIQHTLPWCMAQQFNTRLYAQVCLRKVWQHCKDHALATVLERFGPVQDCLQSVEHKCSGTINQRNMLNDFYFQVFHPMEHFSVETIFYDLPRLSVMTDEEWLSLSYIDNILKQDSLSLSHIQAHQSKWSSFSGESKKMNTALCSSNSILSSSEPAPWVLKAVGVDMESQESCNKSEDTIFVQKKITPWKSMLPELLNLVDIPRDASKNKDRSGLVVVASLVDKAANLGGLCRTCEIFSVREFVIPSNTILDDHIFKSLSVTAEQWQPVKEVKKGDLMSYLRIMRNAGYTIVGVEQADNSIKLSDYTFPERTLLLLGNEHEGIPCELLQMLDVCIEIPQTGVIRSLNVHVSGALFVWEYAHQQIQKII